MNRQRPVRPENAIAQPVGNIHRAVRVQTNHARLREVKIGVVRGDHGIVEHRILQLLRAFNAAGNHRVGVQRPPIQLAASSNI